MQCYTLWTEKTDCIHFNIRWLHVTLLPMGSNADIILSNSNNQHTIQFLGRISFQVREEGKWPMNSFHPIIIQGIPAFEKSIINWNRHYFHSFMWSAELCTSIIFVTQTIQSKENMERTNGSIYWSTRISGGKLNLCSNV